MTAQAHSDDEAKAIAVDGSGNVYVTGQLAVQDIVDDYATIKYNSAGQQQWVARYDGPADYSDQATAIAVDGSGSVYVTGRSYGSGSSYDYATIRYNSSGQQQWVARYDGPVNYEDAATAIAVDGSGSVYVTGASYGSESDYDYATIKYSRMLHLHPRLPHHTKAQPDAKTLGESKNRVRLLRLGPST